MYVHVTQNPIRNLPIYVALLGACFFVLWSNMQPKGLGLLLWVHL